MNVMLHRQAGVEVNMGSEREVLELGPKPAEGADGRDSEASGDHGPCVEGIGQARRVRA